MAAVISCISCHRETVKTLTAACCVSICFKRLHKIGSWSHIRKCCEHVEDSLMNPSVLHMLNAMPNLKRSYLIPPCITMRTWVFLSSMKRFYATNCCRNTVCFSFARSGFCLCLWTNAWKWKWLQWINHDIAHIKEMFPPNSKVATEKKKWYPKFYDVCHFYSSQSLHFQEMPCWNVPDTPPGPSLLETHDLNEKFNIWA